MSFEDEFGEALRRAGDGFTADRHALVEAGERRGLRLVARRRAAVIGGSVLSLALIGGVGAYAGGLLDGSGRAEVAMPPSPSGGPSGGGGTPEPPPVPPRGAGTVSAEQLVEALKGLLTEGDLSVTKARGTDGTGAGVMGVYDDGEGGAEISLSLSRVDPNGSQAFTETLCSKKYLTEGGDCAREQLADGSKLLIEQQNAPRDLTPGHKRWRAALVTPQGYLVKITESNSPFGVAPGNAPSESANAFTRTDPPLSPARLKALVTSDKWHPALDDLPPANPWPKGWSPMRDNALRDLKAVDQLQKIMGGGMKFPVVSKGGEGGSGYVVIDDGKGKSLVRLDVVKETGVPVFEDSVAPLHNGIRIKITQGPAEKGRGVVQWTVDSLRKNGLRVTATAYNTADPNGSATREAPALTLEELQRIVTDGTWSELDESTPE
ncbi:hypothetical protein ACFXB3_16910 [Streptomyces sp. NPDC059447]|uniref:hypothetical protein n=1 Tax=Streptomyces sp. NPDC059447 TaxID=3346834 RepID=UPI0036A72369